MGLYRVDGNCVRSDDKKVNLKFNEKVNNKEMLKIQIDSSISNQIGPREILDSIKRSNELVDEQILKIKGKEYTLELIRNKSDVYVLGNNPSDSFNINDGFFGTIIVSQKFLNL